MNIYKAIRGNFEKSTAGELLTNYFRIKTMVYLQKLIFHLKKKKNLFIEISRSSSISGSVKSKANSKNPQKIQNLQISRKISNNLENGNTNSFREGQSDKEIFTHFLC